MAVHDAPLHAMIIGSPYKVKSMLVYTYQNLTNIGSTFFAGLLWAMSGKFEFVIQTFHVQFNSRLLYRVQVTIFNET